jgi:anti-sigma regulatory factor (Ser/Thr protein kinase)
MPTSTIAIPPAPEHVRVVRMVAGAAARRGRVPAELIDEVRLAVGEAVARVVLRHRRADIDEDVVVTIHDDPEAFEVEITDLAPSDLPDIDDGLSIALAQALAPHSSMAPGPDGVQLVKLAWPLDESS